MSINLKHMKIKQTLHYTPIGDFFVSLITILTKKYNNKCPRSYTSCLSLLSEYLFTNLTLEYVAIGI